MESFRLEKAFKAESNHISVVLSCLPSSNAVKKNLKEKLWDLSIARVQIKYFTIASSNLFTPKNQIIAISVTLTRLYFSLCLALLSPKLLHPKDLEGNFTGAF